MKNLLIAALFLAALFVPAFADDVTPATTVDVYWSPLGINLITPLQVDSIVSIYDFEHGTGFLGASTELAEWNKFILNVGGITSDLFAGSPFVSVNYDFADVNLTSLEIPLSHLGFVVGVATDHSYIVGIITKTEFQLWK